MFVQCTEHATKKRGFAIALKSGLQATVTATPAKEVTVAIDSRGLHQVVLANLLVLATVFVLVLQTIDANVSKDGADQTVH